VLFFKRQWPIIVAFSVGIVMWARYYIPTEQSRTIQDVFTNWDRIIFGFAAALAVLSMLHHHYTKVRRKRPGYAFSYITLGSFVVMALAGFLPLHLPGFTGIQRESEGLHMWMFNWMFVPMQATMFSVLAFFIASAAFRAFRARSTEATALLVTACLMMIGRVPVGEWIANNSHHFQRFGNEYKALDFPALASWLLNVPNAAAQRGILLGLILSYVAIAIRIIFGIERTYMGGGD